MPKPSPAAPVAATASDDSDLKIPGSLPPREDVAALLSSVPQSGVERKGMPRNGSLNRRGSYRYKSENLALSSMHSLYAPVENQVTQYRHGIQDGLEGYHSWFNVLLIFVPIGILGRLFGLSDTYVFIFNFLACIPLATILGRATEDIASYTNDTIGGLINATFGNAVELILSVSALQNGYTSVIKATLVGSVLSNLLLVLGSSIFCGGVLYAEQEVLPVAVETNANVLQLAVFSFFVPTVMDYVTPDTMKHKKKTLEVMSLLLAVMMLAIYGMYLFFQLFTHIDAFNPDEDEEAGPSEASPLTGREDEMSIATVSSEDVEPVATLPVAIAIMVVDVIFVSLCCENLVDTIEEFSQQVGLDDKFISIILLPIIGNAVEHLSAIIVAMKNKMDLSVGIAAGSSVQIAVFAAPFMVVLSWLYGPVHLTMALTALEAL